MTLTFTFGGAYYAAARSFQGKRLDVDVHVDRRTVRLAPFLATLTGTVRAEGLAAAALASGALQGGLAGIECTLDFVTDDDRPAILSFSQSLTRVTIRSLTELMGCITERNTGIVLGRVRLRFDVRRALGW